MGNIWEDFIDALMFESKVHYKALRWETVVEYAQESVEAGNATPAQIKLVEALKQIELEQKLIREGDLTRLLEYLKKNKLPPPKIVIGKLPEAT